MTKTFQTPANFSRLLYQNQDFIRTLYIFPYYLSSLLLIQHKNFNFKAHFLFSKKCKGGTLDKIFLQLLQTLTDHCAKARFSFELYIFFPYYLSSLLLIQLKNFNSKAHFLFSKKCKGGTLDKNFLQLLQNLTGYCTCLLYTSPSPRDGLLSRMPSSA